MNLLRENTYMLKDDLSTESINIFSILELESMFWMNLGSLAYFLTNEPQNIDENGLLSEIFETRYFHMTRCSVLYMMDVKNLIVIGNPYKLDVRRRVHTDLFTIY